MEKTWEINGLALPLDLEDVATVERLESALAQMAEDEKAIPDDGKISVRLRAYCMMYHPLYDTVFGDGTSEKLFGDRLNAAEHDAVYESFLDFMRTQTTATAERRAQHIRKYMPKRENPA